jgi:ketosteroid isomerase-like protein
MNEVGTRNEERVRNLFATHNRGPDAMLAVLEELLDPEVVWTPAIIGGLEGGNYKGYAGMRRYYADREDVFEKGQVHVLDTEAVCEDVVIAHVLSTGVGRASGASLEQELWMAMWMRDGRVLHWYAFPSRREAIEAVDA